MTESITVNVIRMPPNPFDARNEASHFRDLSPGCPHGQMTSMISIDPLPQVSAVVDASVSRQLADRNGDDRTGRSTESVLSSHLRFRVAAPGNC